MTQEDFHKQYTEPGLIDKTETQTLPRTIGPYKIEALLSRGGMSWLYMGIHPETKQPIAIKVLSSSHIKDKDAVERFLKESHLIALANHPNIVKLYGEGPWEGGLYIAMEWIHGISLRQFLSEQSFSLKRSLDIILQIALALKHLHSHGIIHRDLKPENILISENGLIKVIDFGISQTVKEPSVESSRQKMGTPNYMSPEQKQAPFEVTYASDIYSLGVLAYELILGKLSYGVIQTSLLPKNLRKIISKALAISVQERYQKIDDFIDAITEYLESNAIEKEKPDQDQITEILETFQKTAFALSPFPIPSWPVADVGRSLLKSTLNLGLYYDIFIFLNNTYFIFIADPLSQELNSLFSSANLRGVVKTLVEQFAPKSSSDEFLSNSFIRALHKQMQADPLISSFAVSYLLLNPGEDKLSFFNAGLSQLIHTPAGEESSMIINSNPLLKSDEPSDLLETSGSWKVGDVILLHSFILESIDSFERQQEIELLLKETLKKELFLSAQAQADSITKNIQHSPLFTKKKQTHVLFSIQRTA